jgi:phosphatidate cytidylyltransferase
VLVTEAVILASLILGTAIRWLSLRSASADLWQKRMASLKTWWAIAILFCLALLFGRVGGVLLFALVSLLAVKEFMTLTRVEYIDWRVVGLTYLLVALNYAWILLAWHELFVVFLPLAGLLMLAIRMVARDRATGFLLAAGSSYWGLILTGYCLSHAPLLLTLADEKNPVAGAIGWFLYLVLLVAISDIAQALVGRPFGRHKIAPVLSPKKSWEGFFGGIATTTVIAVLLAPALTPLAEMPIRIGTFTLAIAFLPAVLAGLIVSVLGYFGDLTISGVKRDVGVKDSGTMLPGQGGILDRIDSLMFAAPAFYYYVIFLSGA